MITLGKSKIGIVFLHNGSYIDSYKSLKALGKAAAAEKTTPQIYIYFGNYSTLTHDECTSLHDIENIEIIDELNKIGPLKKICVVEAGSIVPASYFYAINKHHAEGIILPQFLINFGEDFTIQNIAESEQVSRNIINNSNTLLQTSPRLVGKDFVAEIHNILNQDQKNARILIERYIKSQSDKFIYSKAEPTFFRIDKYSRRIENSDFYSHFTSKEMTFVSYTEKKFSNSVGVAIPGHLRAIGVNEHTMFVWAKANESDLQIRPTSILINDMIIKNIDSDVVQLFNQLIADRHLQYSNLILLPHIGTGGADKAALALVHYLSQTDEKTLVITTEVTSQAPENKTFSEYKNITLLGANEILKSYDKNTQIEVFRLLIGCYRIKSIDIINSQLGYSLASYFDSGLDYGIDIYIHAYAHVYEEGYRVPPFHNGLADFYPHTKQYITDSYAFKKELTDVYGITPENITPVAVPQEPNVITKSDYTKKSRLLWIGRVAEEKLFRHVMKIAEEIHRTNRLTVEIWGPIDETYIKKDEIMKAPGISYMGVYDDISKVDFNNYDMLLFTTINEGIPNVLVEASMAGIFIVTPSVGGIPEIVRFDENALQIKDAYSVNEYISAILKVYKYEYYADSEKLSDYSQVLSSNRSWNVYKQSINSIRNATNGE